MTIRSLVWDVWNSAHIRKHHVTIAEVEEACESEIKTKETYGGRLALRRNRSINEPKRTEVVPTVKKKKAHKIPVFASLAEEATFWDTHDVTDYFDEMRDVKVKFSLRTPKEKSLTVRMQGALKKKLEAVAAKQGLQPSSLVRTWLVEKLGRSSVSV